MKKEDLLKLVSNTIETVSPLFTKCINELTNKLIIADGDNVDENGIITIKDDYPEDIDDETYDKLSMVENFMFNAFGNILKAKECMGEELDIAEILVKNQYEIELHEAMEMYRDFRNTEEILNDGENEQSENT